MDSETPGQGAGPDQPEPTSPAAPEPAWTTPPPAAAAGAPAPGSWNAAPQQPAPQPAPQPGWGQPADQGQWGAAPQQPAPAPQPAPQWGAQPQPSQWGQPAPQQPAAQQGWGQQPQAPQPQQPAWNPAPAQQQPAQPAWGQQPGQQPGQPQQPAWNPQPQAPQQPGWTQPPVQQPPQQGQWGAPAATGYGAPPPQGPAPQPGWGQPGQPQQGWVGAPPPAKTGMSGCLKACLVVGVIGIVLVVIAIVALGALVKNAADGIGIDSNGNLKDCSIVSSKDLQTVLGPDTEAHPLTGIANAAIGVTLDKRVLPDADNCYILSGAGATASSDQLTGGYGRIAKYSGDATGTYNKELQNAKTGQYFAIDVPGAGDQAFCTGWSDKYPATGALVRKGGDLVYVSLLIGANFNFDQSSADGGVPYSQSACDQAVAIAKLALH